MEGGRISEAVTWGRACSSSCKDSAITFPREWWHAQQHPMNEFSVAVDALIRLLDERLRKIIREELSSMPHGSPRPANAPAYLTTKMVAARLGLAEVTLHQWRVRAIG